jgi:phosphoribosyl 1,2-cyclic phosphate phosphodiesterase
MIDEVELLFLGTGTSAGIPMIGCACEVCTSTDPRDQRTRPSVLISYNDTRVLVDTTPELRVQCIANRVERIDAVVYTHAHADHIMGLDDVRRFNVVLNGPLDVWGDGRTLKTLTTCFAYAFNGPNPDPSVFRPHLEPRTITGPFEIGGVTWTPIPLFHGKLPILGFRVGNLAYCTDVNLIPDESFDLLRGVDTLVIDALRWKPHTTHFSVDEAIAAARRIRPRRTLFTHISHDLGHAAATDRLPPGFELGYDGQRVAVKSDPPNRPRVVLE